MLPFSNRMIYLAVFLACTGLLASAYYFEYVMYMDPCPLCIMQRIAVLIVGIGGLLGFLLGRNQVARLVGAVVMCLGALLGLGVAGRHVWIQSLPADQVPTCGPSLEYMVDTLPWADVLTIMLRGNGNCADAHWLFLGLSMPQWVLVWFVGFTLVGVYLAFNRKKQ
ncbi:MAG: disulfide bond formation protein B [Bermanella sp.]|nr:disulfide bond formation protein B [Bermanella sp.]|tara:strand:+ start:2137 stop:2634 length:498 start_codon:yes stop_codon:yes gene_type:complete